MQIKEMEMAISQQSRCSQRDFGDLRIFPQMCVFWMPFGPEIHQKIGDSSWVDLLYNLFLFQGSFGSGLELEKCKTRNFSIRLFQSFFQP